PWNKGIEKQIAKGVIELLEHSSASLFARNSPRNLGVEIQFRYGIYALKYFYYRFRSHLGDSTIDQ
ncbi:MAG: hypothetical protein HQK53_11690, partial [Oligoflexia bacterium]|nr:hypothetical protein [Oligoflexia bacterium]